MRLHELSGEDREFLLEEAVEEAEGREIEVCPRACYAIGGASP